MKNSYLHEEKNNTKPISAIVVDDSTDIVDLLSDFLEFSKVTVLGSAYDGKQAVELYKKVKPDVVLLDIMMPEYDGFYAMEKIRQINCNAKILMVTADFRKETADRLERTRGLKIIYKPFDFNHVLEGIRNLLDSDVQAMAYQGGSYSMRSQS
jgi:DNA-binding response OmpR family regulator